MTAPESIQWAPLIAQTLIATLLSGSIVGLFLKTLVDRRMEQARLTREWKEQALASLIAPVVMHLARTTEIAERYQHTFQQKTKSYFDAQLMRDSNAQVRSILLSHGHLLPECLRPHAHRLIAHYDVWLGRFDAKVALEKPTSESAFDIGFVELPFPEQAKDMFLAEYANLRTELYGVRPMSAAKDQAAPPPASMDSRP